MKTDDELIGRAMRAYVRRFGREADQPSFSYSEVGGEVGRIGVRLANVNGLLAMYTYYEETDELRWEVPPIPIQERKRN